MKVLVFPAEESPFLTPKRLRDQTPGNRPVLLTPGRYCTSTLQCYEPKIEQLPDFMVLVPTYVA